MFVCSWFLSHCCFIILGQILFLVGGIPFASKLDAEISSNLESKVIIFVSRPELKR